MNRMGDSAENFEKVERVSNQGSVEASIKFGRVCRQKRSPQKMTADLSWGTVTTESPPVWPGKYSMRSATLPRRNSMLESYRILGAARLSTCDFCSGVISLPKNFRFSV